MDVLSVCLLSNSLILFALVKCTTVETAEDVRKHRYITAGIQLSPVCRCVEDLPPGEGGFYHNDWKSS